MVLANLDKFNDIQCVFLIETLVFLWTAGFIMERMKNLVNCRKRRQVRAAPDGMFGVKDEEDRELLCTKLATNPARILTWFWNTIKLYIISILIYETSAKASSQRVNSLSPGPVKLSTRTWYFLLNSRGIWYRGNLLSLPLNLFLKHIYNLQASIKVWPLRNISFNRSHSIDMRGDEKLPMQKK